MFAKLASRAAQLVLLVVILFKPFLLLLGVVALLREECLVFKLFAALEELFALGENVRVFFPYLQFAIDVCPCAKTAKSLLHEGLEPEGREDDELAGAVYHVGELHEVDSVASLGRVEFDGAGHVLRVHPVALSVLHQKPEDVCLGNRLVVVGVEHVEHECNDLLPGERAEVDEAHDELLERHFITQLLINQLKEPVAERGHDRVLPLT